MTEHRSHPDFTEANMKVTVTLTVTENDAYMSGKAWAKVSHEISTAMSPAAALATLHRITEAAVLEVDAQFMSTAEVTRASRADQVKQLTVTAEEV